MDHASDVAVLRLWKHEPKALTDFIFLLWLASSDTQVVDTKHTVLPCCLIPHLLFAGVVVRESRHHRVRSAPGLSFQLQLRDRN